MQLNLVQLKHYVLDWVPGNEVLWITFDHAGLPKHRAEGRIGWGIQELAKHGWSVLAIKAREPDWFLKPDLAEFFRGPSFSKLIKSKKRVILYGLSMGGFGAFVYSTMVPGSVVLAISPQSTLDPAKVPWEKRFDYALGEDWTGPIGDVNTLTPAHAEAYVLYCPGNKFDGPHMDRLDRFGPITYLPLDGNTHTPGGLLMEGGFLKALVAEVAKGPIDESIFDLLEEELKSSAAYHFFRGSEETDQARRDDAFARCLELAPANRLQFYMQRIAGFQMRCASKDGDATRTHRHYMELRKCEAWRESVTLKLMAARYLLRVQAVDTAAKLLKEIRHFHPEGHRKLPDVQQRYEDALAELKNAADTKAADDEPRAEHG